MLALGPPDGPRASGESSINNVLARLNGDSSWVEDALGFLVFAGSTRCTGATPRASSTSAVRRVGPIATIRRARE